MNKKIIVTGASSGIGKKTAQMLMDERYKVILTARNKENLIETIKDYPSESYEIIPWDLSDVDSLTQYAKEVNEKAGSISGLVHCAGIQITVPLYLINKKRLIDIFNINTFAAINLVGLFSKRKYYIEGETSFVLLSSIAAHEGEVGNSIYAASKGALEGFLTSAAAELVSKGIRLNIIVPGMIETNMNEEFFKYLTEEQKERFKQNYPLGYGQSEDIANMIIYLISKKSKWITGQKFIIDGGHLSRKV